MLTIVIVLAIVYLAFYLAFNEYCWLHFKRKNLVLRNVPGITTYDLKCPRCLHENVHDSGVRPEQDR